MDDDKKRPFLHRMLTFLITAALSLTALFLGANWQKLNFDFIRRYFTYRSLERNESGQVESFRYTGGSGSSFALLGSDLLVCSSSGVRLYSESGAAYVDQACNLTTAAEPRWPTMPADRTFLSIRTGSWFSPCVWRMDSPFSPPI